MVTETETISGCLSLTYGLTTFYLALTISHIIVVSKVVMEPRGWPLGLGIMNIRLRVRESLPAAAVQPYSVHMPSTSFSSFSSSNLDTESTASFFQDRSMSLGRLIGIKPGERGGFYVPNSKYLEEQHRISAGDAQSDASRNGVDMSRAICIPLVLGALVKMNRSKSKSRK